MRIIICLFIFAFCSNSLAQKTQYPAEPEVLKNRQFSREPVKIIVDLSDKKCYVEFEDKTMVFWAEGATKGIGFELGTNKTPVGEYLFLKQTHRYGNVLRLTGKKNNCIKGGFFQGWERGILVHKDYEGGSKGCIHIKKRDMDMLYSMVYSNYDLLIIRE